MDGGHHGEGHDTPTRRSRRPEPRDEAREPPIPAVRVLHGVSAEPVPQPRTT